jgi:hypothetical protein
MSRLKWIWLIEQCRVTAFVGFAKRDFILDQGRCRLLTQRSAVYGTRAMKWKVRLAACTVNTNTCLIADTKFSFPFNSFHFIVFVHIYYCMLLENSD